MALAASTSDRSLSDSAVPEASGGRNGGRSWFGVGVIGLGLVVCAASAVFLLAGDDQEPVAAVSSRPIPPQYDPDRAFGYLLKICEFGSRPTGSDAMRQQQEFLTDFFEQRGASVRLQETQIRHPLTGEAVPMANLIATWFPDRPTRFLLCAHYDTRPFPDRDRTNPKGVFIGANDGASGVAAVTV